MSRAKRFQDIYRLAKMNTVKILVLLFFLETIKFKICPQDACKPNWRCDVSCKGSISFFTLVDENKLIFLEAVGMINIYSHETSIASKT